MTTKDVTINITGSTVQGLGVDGGQATVTNSNQTVATPAAPLSSQDLDRDQFERDVNDVLHLLADAQEHLGAEFELLRVALRKLNTVEIERSSELSDVRAKYEAMLTAKDKNALAGLAGASKDVATNIVSSSLWTYLIQPIIAGLG